MKKRILFVDDQPKLLRGIRRSLFEMTSEWDMEFADSGQKALEVLEKAPFDAIVSDMRMPGMDGADLLKEIAKRFPSSIRIILSGYSDEKMIMKSIGQTHQFLAKPLNGKELQETLARAFALRDILTDTKLKTLISDLRSLPSLPTLYQELMLELQSPDVTMQKLGEIISRDIGMTAKMMQLVNSAFFGLPIHVFDPMHAAKLLGPVILRALVLSVQVFSKFDRVVSCGLSIEKFTNHSLAVASVAKNIAISENQSKKIADNALIAGLLHDVGKLILAQNLPETYNKNTACAKDKNITISEAEQSTIGVTHAEVGAYLLGLWGLPDDIVEAVAFHHRPLSWVDKSFSALTAVHVADVLEHEFDEGKNDAPHSTINLEYLDKLGLTNQVSEWQEICKKSKQKTDSQ